PSRVTGVKILSCTFKRFSTLQAQSDDEGPEEHAASLQFNRRCARVSLTRFNTIGDQDENVAVPGTDGKVCGRLKQRIGDGRYAFGKHLCWRGGDVVVIAGTEAHFKLGILAVVGLPVVRVAIYPQGEFRVFVGPQ